MSRSKMLRKRLEKLGYWLSSEKVWNPSWDFVGWEIGYLGNSNGCRWFRTLDELEDWIYEEKIYQESLKDMEE